MEKLSLMQVALFLFLSIVLKVVQLETGYCCYTGSNTYFLQFGVQRRTS